MAAKKPKLSSMNKMKKKSTTIFYTDDIAARVAVIKSRPGGLTAFFDRCVREADISAAELKAAAVLKL